MVFVLLRKYFAWFAGCQTVDSEDKIGLSKVVLGKGQVMTF